MDDKDIQGFIDYFGEENIPNPEQYTRRVEWLMKWYMHIVMRNREDDNG